MGEVLRGNLRRIGLPSVLQLGEAEALTGSVELLELGDVKLSKGRPVDASCGTLTGVNALLELFVRSASDFRVVEDAVGTDEPLGSLVGLIMEGCRLADEWRRLAPLPLATTEPGVVDRAGAAAPVVAVLGDEPTVEAAVQRAGVARALVVDPLQALLEEGALRERTRPPPPRRSRPPSGDYYTAIDQGRKHLRAGRFAEAEAAFEIALAERPGDRVAAQNLRRVRQVREGESSGLFGWFRKGR